MAFQYLSLSLALTLLSLPSLDNAEFVNIKSPRLLDLAIRDYTFRSHDTNFKTGELRRVDLAPNLPGVNVDSIRLRCGSLQRYGANITEFRITSGVNVYPCSTRVFLIRQSIGLNWSSLYYNAYDLSGYQLISPVLGLKAYQIEKQSSNNATEVNIRSGKRSITIDFSRTALVNTSSRISPVCASFDGEGKMSLSNQKEGKVCVAKGGGHFGLVVESAFKGKESRGKIVVVSSIGAALGAFLLSLLMVAMLAKAKKKKEMMDEMERRAYEEEAFQVSMVGHVTTTAPTIQYPPQYSSTFFTN